MNDIKLSEYIEPRVALLTFSNELLGLSPIRVAHGWIAGTWRWEDASGKAVYYLKKHPVASGHDSLKEVGVLRWLRGKLPVPEVVGFETDESDHWLLMTALPGIPAHELAGRLNPEEMIRMMAEGLRLIRGVETGDCPFDESCESKLLRVQKNMENKQLRSDLYPRDDIAKAEADLRWLREHLPAQERVFSHGDWCLPNALAESGKITGFIDWGEGGIANPWQDVAMLATSMCYNYNTPDRHEEYARMIVSEAGLGELDRNKLRFFRLLNEML